MQLCILTTPSENKKVENFILLENKYIKINRCEHKETHIFANAEMFSQYLILLSVLQSGVLVQAYNHLVSLCFRYFKTMWSGCIGCYAFKGSSCLKHAAYEEWWFAVWRFLLLYQCFKETLIATWVKEKFSAFKPRYCRSKSSKGRL